jgi:DNA-binding GntR family transcriptional regulator
MTMSTAPLTEEARVVDQLRALILSGALPWGQFLSQRMLASRLATTLITVRAALRAVESDGLIENVPRWGVRIPVESEAKLRDRYFVRELLEAAAARRVAERSRPQELDRRLLALAEACDAIEVDPGRVAEFSQAHLDLHVAIAEAAGSPLLADQLRRMGLRSLLLGNARRGWSQARYQPDWHLALVRTLLGGEAGRAEAAMRHHVRAGLEAELSTLGTVTEGAG